MSTELSQNVKDIISASVSSERKKVLEEMGGITEEQLRLTIDYLSPGNAHDIDVPAIFADGTEDRIASAVRGELEVLAVQGRYFDRYVHFRDPGEIGTKAFIAAARENFGINVEVIKDNIRFASFVSKKDKVAADQRIGTREIEEKVRDIHKQLRDVDSEIERMRASINEKVLASDVKKAALRAELDRATGLARKVAMRQGATTEKPGKRRGTTGERNAKKQKVAEEDSDEDEDGDEDDA